MRFIMSNDLGSPFPPRKQPLGNEFFDNEFIDKENKKPPNKPSEDELSMILSKSLQPPEEVEIELKQKHVSKEMSGELFPKGASEKLSKTILGKELVEEKKLTSSELDKIKKELAGSYADHGKILEKYGIKDQKTLVEIADWLSENKPDFMCFYLQDVDIKDQSALLKIAKQTIKHDFEQIGLFANKLDDSTYIDLFLKNLPRDFSKLQRAFKDGEIRYLPAKLPSVEDCFKKIGCERWLKTFDFIKNGTDDEKITLLWALSSAVLLSSKGIDSLPDDTKDIWKAIFDYRDPNMRYELSKRVGDFSNKGTYETYGKLTQGKAHMMLPALFMLQHKELAVKELKDNEKEDALAKLGTLRSQLKDASLSKVVIDTLFLLGRSKTLNGGEIRTILNITLQGVMEAKDVEVSPTLKSHLFLLQGILWCGEEAKLKDVAKWEDIERIHKEALQSTFSDINISDFTTKFQNTFGKCRNASALLLYAGKMKTIEDEDEDAMKTLNSFVKSVAEGKIAEQRYDETKNEHLQTVFGAQKGLKEKWRVDTREPLIEKGFGESLNFKDLLLQKLDHIPHELSYVRDMLQKEEKNHVVEDLKKALEDVVKLMKQAEENKKLKAGGLKESKDPMQLKKELKLLDGDSLKLKESYRGLTLQQDLIDLIRGTTNEKHILDRVMKNLKEIPQLKSSQLSKDLAELAKQTKGEELGARRTIGCTDNYWDLFMCGTETFSCQSVNGTPSINKHLMNYPMDGKIRLVSIQEPDGTILSRCIIRLLWDTDKKRPVILQEKNYYRTADPDFEKRLNAYCEKYAKSLDLPLYRSGGKKNQSAVSLKSFNSVAYCEYVDSVGVHRAETDGKYTIDQAEFVQK